MTSRTSRTARRVTRNLVLALFLTTAGVVALATSASARVAPDPDYILQPTTPLVDSPSPLPYVVLGLLVAFATLAATLAVQGILRRAHVRHAVASA